MMSEFGEVPKRLSPDWDGRASGGSKDSGRDSMIREAKDALVKINFLDKDPERRDEINTKIRRVFKEYFRFESVDEMLSTAADEGNLRQKEAQTILEEIPKVVVGSMLESTGGLDEEFFLGSDHVTGLLPEGLKKIGKQVSEVFVPDKQINDSLNRIEEERRECRHVDGGTATLSHFISRTLEKDIRPGLDKIKNSKVRFSVRRAVMALDHENTVLKRELGDTRVGGAEGYDERSTKKSASEQRPPSGEKKRVTTISVLQEINTNVTSIVNAAMEKGSMTQEQAESVVNNISKMSESIEKGGEITNTQLNNILNTIVGIINNIGVQNEQFEALKTIQDEIKNGLEGGMTGILNKMLLSLKDISGFTERTAIGVEKIALDVERIRENTDKCREIMSDNLERDRDKSNKRIKKLFERVANVDNSDDIVINIDDLNLVFQEDNTLTNEEKIKEIIKTIFGETANVTADIFLDKMKAAFNAYYGSNNSEMRKYWDNKFNILNKRLIELRKSGSSGNSEIIKKLEDQILILRELRGERTRSPERNQPVTVSEIEKMLYQIEESGKESNDISLNTDKLRRLFDVLNDEVKIVGLDQRNPEHKIGIDRLKDYIKVRLLINDWFLAASVSHTIEDMMKTTMRIHQGDTDGTLDKMMLTCLMDARTRTGFNFELHVDEAWDLRQRAYFEYVMGTIDLGNGKYLATGGYLYELWNNAETRGIILEGYRKENKGKSLTDEEIRKRFLTVSRIMRKHLGYGIEKDYYTNLRNEDQTIRRAVVEKCMAKQIEKGMLNEKDESVRKMRANRAVELARRLSVLTYQDSVANIAFTDADDYAEIVNFKFIRFQDGVEPPAEKENEIDDLEGPKNKAVGYYDLIRYIDSLSPTYLQTLVYDVSKADEGMLLRRKNICGMLMAKDIDYENIKRTMLYHLSSIVFKKVLPTQQLFLKPQTPKDFEDFNELRRRYDQMNKIITEAYKKGWNLLNLKANGMDETTPLSVKEKKFRALYILNVFGLALDSPTLLGWSRDTRYMIKQLLTSPRFVDSDGRRTIPFLSENYWNWIMQDFIKNPRNKKEEIEGWGIEGRMNQVENRNIRRENPIFMLGPRGQKK